MKNCPAGQYYCTKSKKCKPIPKGWHVMRSGYLTRDDDDGQKSKKNGNGNGNGHSGANGSSAGNGNGNGNGSSGGVSEGSLHKWFKGSKSKDGKGGWVNVVTGGTCASDKPGEGTPKCVSSSKRASMTKAERLSASRRKKKADPNQQSKSGAAKPTYVSTDKKKMKEDWKPEIEHSKMGDAKKKADKKRESKLPPHLQGDAIGKMKKAFATEEDKKGKGSGKKDACYHKVKASAKVWPSAYASGRLVQCRKKGAANYGNKSEEVELKTFDKFYDECWKTHKKVGMKKKGGKMVPDCRPKNEETVLEKVAAWQRKEGKNKSGGLNEKGRKSYERENPGSDLKAPQPEGGPRKRSFCARMGGMKGPMKDEKGRPTRKALALRKWKC
jgi:hypothetical protein